MPKPGSGRAFKASSYIGPLSMMLYGGGEAIEEVREIREDHPFKRSDTDGGDSFEFSDWRLAEADGERGGIEGMERINDGMVKAVLKREDRKGYTLIADPRSLRQKRERRG